MHEDTDPEKDDQTENEETPDKTIPDAETETAEDPAWARDQREKSYYYDDSHGYEIYDPDLDEEDDREP